jgi:hypothetical protein
LVVHGRRLVLEATERARKRAGAPVSRGDAYQDYTEGGVAVNRRDLKKATPFFEVLLIVAAVLYVVGRFLL